MTALLVIALVLAIMGCIALWLRTDTLKSEKEVLEATVVNTKLDLAAEKQKREDAEALVERQSKTLADAERVMDFFNTPVEVTTTERVATQTEIAPGTYTSTEKVTVTAPVRSNKKSQRKKVKLKDKPSPKKKAQVKAKPKAKKK